MKELNEVINRNLEKFENKNRCYNCGSKENTKSFMAISENDSYEDESEIILKFCCLCYECFNNESAIAKTVDKVFKRENVDIIEKSVDPDPTKLH